MVAAIRNIHELLKWGTREGPALPCLPYYTKVHLPRYKTALEQICDIN